MVKEDATLDSVVDKNITGLIFNASALIDVKRLLWRVWGQVCECHPSLHLTYEDFKHHVVHSSHPSPKNFIQHLIHTSPHAMNVDAREVLMSYVKFYERALIVTARDVTRNEAVCSLAKKYFKTIPLAIISNDPSADVIQLLTSSGLLHLFDVVIGQEEGGSISQVDMFRQAAQRLNVPSDLCLGLDDVDETLVLQRQAGNKMYDVKLLTLGPPHVEETGALSCPLQRCSNKDLDSSLLLIVIFLVCAVAMFSYHCFY